MLGLGCESWQLLLSPAASFITATTLVVDGGSSLVSSSGISRLLS